MSKEIYISSTPHETRLAIVEGDALAEIYYERENEYTLAGSIYNGRVTRVLPGMQSSFVDIGLERDAFLYITDFLEEAPDSEEFDTAPAGDRARTGENRDHGDKDRGGRGRRGGRDRNRGDRNGDPQKHGHAAPESGSNETTGDDAEGAFPESQPVEGNPEAGAEGSAEGGRRWRGRRGRRRGRGGNRPDQPQQEGVAPSTPEAGGAADEDFGAEPSEFSASSEPSFEEMARPQHVSPDRDRNRNDGGRNRGEQHRREGRGFESRREGFREQSGGQDSSRRSPRGFEPRRDRYGAGDEPSGTGPVAGAYDAPAAGEEIMVLPGESLARHRRGGDAEAAPPASTTSAPSIASTTPLAPPASLYTLAEGWDGGDVLPGETIRPRGPESRAAEPRNFDRGSGRGPRRDHDNRRDNRGARRDHRDDPRFDSRPAPRRDEFAASTTESPSAVPVPEAEPAPVTEPPVETAAIAAQPHIHTEYEPTEASASYRVDPIPPSEFRQSAPVAEETEPAAEAHDITSLSAAGEMHSDVAEVLPAHPVHPVPMEPAEPADPIRHEGAVVSAEQFHEEIIDEEEGSRPTLHASSIEEMDDLDEETLEGAADLATMLREMSIDQITRTEPELDEEDDLEDEDDFEEDLLEEDELDEGDEDEEDAEGFERAEGEAAAASGISDAFERVESGEESFDAVEVEDAHFAAEPESGHAEAHTQDQSANRDSERRQRDFGREPDRRPGRRGDRDQRDRNHDRGRGRGRPGHGDRRSRASAQTTNLPAISDLLKPGQEILVQIAKEPIAKKGARITSHIALPGRFLVFMPTVNHTGVSRKIESDGERRRLKEILLSEKGDATGGFIVRTAAEGASEEELRSDLRFLLNLWADIKSRSDSSKSPALIYHDLNLVERILRDQVTDNFSAIWVDTESEYERVLRFLQRFQPSLIRRVKLYLKETPLFEQFGITEEINKALRSKVWLKSGGSIVINQTEALVAIDINTGKYVGKTARLEDTIVKTNLDAIPEIVRQIRLRDLGGIIIIDFIDMDERKNRNRVMAALEEELKNDRAPSKVLQFNDFGLVAITRKRVKQSLERTLSTTCNICTGTGMVKSPVTVCNDIYVEMRKLSKHLDRGDIMLRVHPEVVKQLKSSGSKWLQEMEEMAGKTILVKSDPSLHPEQFDIH